MSDLNCTCESTAAKDCPVAAHHPKPEIIDNCVECGRSLAGCRAVGHPQYGESVCVRDTAGCVKLAKEFKRLCKKLKLTLADVLSIQQAAGAVWEMIGADVLDAYGIPSDSGKTIARAVVIECVLDSSYFRDSDYLTPAAKEVLDYSSPNYNGKAVQQVVKGEFTFARYGW